MTPPTTTLAQQAQAWIRDDVDAESQSEMRDLLARADTDPEAYAELADRFSSRLEFGTAGLRGAMGAGPNRMNRAVVIQAAKGLVDYLSSRVDRPVVVIGNDARHQSRRFALDTAGVVTAHGGDAVLLPDPVPTPVLAYAVRRLGADAGVMVTASHNPAADNGYKVYVGGRMVPDEQRGVQIVPPHDTGIQELIAAAGPANQIRRDQGWTDVSPDLVEAYLDAISASTDPEQCAGAPIRIVHTALHGVGGRPAMAALARAGFTDVWPVAAQVAPDPDFPTVAFPNPEEPGAIDLAIQEAVRADADVVIANDPDADRCAVAVPDPRTGWRMLHGDELGAVLAEDLGPTGSGVFVNSVVSSRQLAVIAAHHGRGYVRTLTGFKWMGRVENLGFAYEEAIGYCVRPDLVRDKDGLSTAVAVARLVSRLKAEGLSICDRLDDLARRHGLYLSSQVSVRVTDQTRIAAIMTRLRTSSIESLAGSAVTDTVDLSLGWGSLPPTDGIVVTTARDDRVIIRPSGTEPKVKCYLEVIEPVSPDASYDSLTASRAAARRRLDQIASDLDAVVFS
ncbi:MAG: phospho-sugar mutase [Propionibacteriaceae bacterium]|nr:phospho-sugar mutase [Propionibacteriaceae bacterium]